MAVQLETLYSEIESEFDVRLLTKSCFNKMIDWVHMVEDIDFVPLLHGDELVLNSGLNYVSNEWLKKFIKALNQKEAGGLILPMRDGVSISQDIIDYCNEIEFALFSATWATPFRDIMRIFSVVLLRNEQRETNLSSALKNAIYFPENEELYLSHFERNDLFKDMDYNVIILSCDTYKTERGNEKLEMIQKGLRHAMGRGIMCEENGRLIILAAGYPEKNILEVFRGVCKKDANIYVGVGTTVHRIQDIHKSYHRAFTAYQLTKTAIAKNLLCYPELGIYKLL
ncbi:MAG: PucR family transcriptional regulator ligand-binding domain-containing protein, partial [Dorea sp.]